MRLRDFLPSCYSYRISALSSTGESSLSQEISECVPDPGSEIITGHYNLANISTVSNKFQLWLDISINDEPHQDVCSDYSFKVKAGGQEKTIPDPEAVVSCEYLENETANLDNSARYRVWFKVKSDSTNPRAAYFEDATVNICNNNTSTCYPLSGLKDNVSVYGTAFDIGVHAWQFANKYWKGEVKRLNRFFWIVDVIDDYVNKDDRNEFWDAVGRKR